MLYLFSPCHGRHFRSRTLDLFFHVLALAELYPLSLHDALPISRVTPHAPTSPSPTPAATRRRLSFIRSATTSPDRKSTRLNSSHRCISYAVFCLKKKNHEVQFHNRSLQRNTRCRMNDKRQRDRL